MGVLPLTYTRPKHMPKESISEASMVSDSESGNNLTNSDGSVKSGKSGSSNGIPESLNFDRIINGGTCPPMTVRDFMNYLIYIEHSAENLQFFLWYRDYVKRFEAASAADKALAPEWTQAMQDDIVHKIRKDNADKMRSEPQAAAIFKGSDFDKNAQDVTPPPRAATGSNPFGSRPRTGTTATDKDSMHTTSVVPSTMASSYKSQAADAFHSAGAKQPCK